MTRLNKRLLALLPVCQPKTKSAVRRLTMQAQRLWQTLTASGLPATGSAITGVAVSADNASGTAATGTSWCQSFDWHFVKDTTKITIVDATGNTILDGDQARGSYQLTGQAPFQVNIDKASNVSLDLNKQPIKLSNYAQNDKANFI